MRFSGLLLFLLALTLFYSCASSRVKTQYDAKTDLKTYKSYRFIDTSNQNVKPPASLVDDAVHDRIGQELKKRGLKPGYTKPNLLIAYHTYTESTRDTINSHYPMMYGGETWRFYPWSATPYPYDYWTGYRPETVTYTEGTLIIDVIDGKSKRLVWRGSISNAISLDPASLHDEAMKAVELVFKKFPLKEPSEKAMAKNTAK